MSHQEQITAAMDKLTDLFVLSTQDGEPVIENGNITLRYRTAVSNADIFLHHLEEKLGKDMPLTYEQSHENAQFTTTTFTVTVPNNLTSAIQIPEICRTVVRERAASLLEEAHASASECLGLIIPEDKVAGEIEKLWKQTTAKDRAARRA